MREEEKSGRGEYNGALGASAATVNEMSAKAEQERYWNGIHQTPWEKASIEVKLDKLRHEIREQRHIFRRVAELSNRLSVLAEHMHASDGRVLVGIHSRLHGDASQLEAGRQDPLA